MTEQLDTAPPLFDAVDHGPDPAALIAQMDDAARYEGVRQLRDWTMRQLRLRPGQRAIDVGCGPGTTTLALAAEVGASGLAIGVDASDAMITEARRRTASIAAVDFRVGDAQHLEIDDRSLDAYRSERTYQWLPDPERALAEAFRVLRPGGRLVLTDTDWSTLVVDHPDSRLTGRILGAPKPPALHHPLSGRELLGRLRRLGARELSATAGTIVATVWDPASGPNVAAMPSLSMLAAGAVEAGVVGRVEADRWVDVFESEARAGRFFLAVTMFAVAGTRP
jgi:SAM-dependent methyltransferase